MNAFNNRLFAEVIISSGKLFPNGTFIYNEPNIDEGQIEEYIRKLVQPISNIALVVIPIIAAAATLVSFTTWFGMDDMEKQQRPFTKVLKRNGIALIVAESIPVLLKFLGY